MIMTMTMIEIVEQILTRLMRQKGYENTKVILSKFCVDENTDIRECMGGAIRTDLTIEGVISTDIDAEIGNKKIEYLPIEQNLPVRHITNNEKLCTRNPITYLQKSRVVPNTDFNMRIEYDNDNETHWVELDDEYKLTDEEKNEYEEISDKFAGMKPVSWREFEELMLQYGQGERIWMISHCGVFFTLAEAVEYAESRPYKFPPEEAGIWWRTWTHSTKGYLEEIVKTLTVDLPDGKGREL